MASLPASQQKVIEALVSAPEGLVSAELVERANLSRPTVRSAVDSLVKEGRIVQSAVAGAVGRPSILYRLAPTGGVIVGLDIGYSHIRVALADAAGTIIAGPIDQPCDTSREGVGALTLAAELVERVLGSTEKSEIRAIGLGLPAPVYKGRVASMVHLRNWALIDVPEALRTEVFGESYSGDEVPVLIANDADLGALGERTHAAAGSDNFVYVKVSSGVGLGVVLDGAIRIGAHGALGEWGHVSTPRDAEIELRRSKVLLPRSACDLCGRLDCLENLASCRAIVDQLKSLEVSEVPPPRNGNGNGNHDADETFPSDSSGQEGTNLVYEDDITIHSVIDNALDSPMQHPLCREAVTNAATRLGYALTDLVRVLDPDTIVIGGVLAGARDLLKVRVDHILRGAMLPPNDVKVVLVPKERIERSEVEGAVALAAEYLRRNVAA